MAKKKIDLSKLNAATAGAAMTDNVDQLKEHSGDVPPKAAGKGGRKPKDPMDKRTEKTTINFTPREKEKLEELIEMGESSYTSIVIKALKVQGII